MRRSVLAAAAALACVFAVPSTASAKVKWLCAPTVKKNPCTPSLKTTVFSSYTNQLRVETPKPARRPKIDCFYVYPTVSNQTTNVATKAAAPEIKSIALYQAARFSQVCRVYAPLYRQITVAGLSRTTTAKERALGDKDILEAWKLYLSRFNKGRGVVLIGHSQGSFRLTTLIQRQIDKKAPVRRKLLSAILLGGNVTVRNGSDRGGSFQNVPACKTNSQLGCVIAFSTYNQTPPDDSLFGRTTAPDQHVLCTNPALLPGGPSDLDSIVPTTPYAPGLIAAGIQLLHFPLPKVSTPFIETKAAFSGECSTEGGASVLRITSKEGTPVPDPSPTPQWGLHLLDGSVALGDLLHVVREETTAFTMHS
jgi:hypothetical protein